MVDAETLYRQMGELLISVPDFYKPGPLSFEGHEWLARAYAPVKVGNDIQDTARMKTAPYRGRRRGSVTDCGARQLHSCR